MALLCGATSERSTLWGLSYDAPHPKHTLRLARRVRADCDHRGMAVVVAAGVGSGRVRLHVKQRKRVFTWKLTGRSPTDGTVVVIGRYEEREREFAERELVNYGEQDYTELELKPIETCEVICK